MKDKMTCFLTEIAKLKEEEDRNIYFDVQKSMVDACNDYVSIVTRMEAMREFKLEDSREHREQVAQLDAMRRNTHNGLIAAVDVANRVCDRLGIARFYEGDAQRRHYGDFAIALVNEIFNNRL